MIRLLHLDHTQIGWWRVLQTKWYSKNKNISFELIKQTIIEPIVHTYCQPIAPFTRIVSTRECVHSSINSLGAKFFVDFFIWNSSRFVRVKNKGFLFGFFPDWFVSLSPCPCRCVFFPVAWTSVNIQILFYRLLVVLFWACSRDMSMMSAVVVVFKVIHSCSSTEGALWPILAPRWCDKLYSTIIQFAWWSNNNT